MLELIGTNVPNHSHSNHFRAVIMVVIPKDREPTIIVSGGY